MAATAQASLLYPVRTTSLASAGVLCALALTEQKTARQQSEADTQVDSRSKNMIFMNFARGINPCESTEIKADK
ncbi:hypothetical protein PENSUB_4363 [Penicillium subrubescens]|uniref:Uncharacterized protein n=1 Tax=Penicillium subrubescens TaxID=1316194 RepID=A0A1Q5UCJ9_9EURO|nr:hypothetical protein PENSUB_4363 [Penicillium subrubescens]